MFFKVFLLCVLLVSVVLLIFVVEYVIDLGYIYVSFEVDYLGFLIQCGQFNCILGSVQFDLEVCSGNIDICIDVVLLDIGFELCDDVLCGEFWFNVKDFFDILFCGWCFVFEDDKLVVVEGMLVMFGEVRLMWFEISCFKCGFNFVNCKCGCGVDV